jgi:uncharacterized membrane protein YfcA
MKHSRIHVNGWSAHALPSFAFFFSTAPSAISIRRMVHPWQIAVLFATGLVAGFVDSIAGGGGLITLPVLLSLGFDTRYALGTNKVQAVFGSGSAAIHYKQARAVELRDCVWGFLLSLTGAALGTIAVQNVDRKLLQRGIPIVLFAVAIYTLLRPRLGEKDLHPRMSRHWFDVLFGLGLGFYDGLLGPGTGTFWTMAFMLGLGFNMVRATAYTKVMNFGSNIGSLVMFVIAGTIYYGPGIAMGAGQLIGAQLGAGMVMKRGTRFIRPIFITVVLALIGKLFYDSYFGSTPGH